MSTERNDIHQTITDRIVTAIEAGAGTWQMPWHRGTGGKRPVNVASERPYNGVNILVLWVEAQVRGFSSHRWGTYRQWASVGGQVRRGEKASQVVFYKEITVASAEDADDEDSKRRLIARATPVFNADQIDGVSESAPTEPAASLAQAEAFVSATGARVVHQGRSACYVPALDEIRMPTRELFTSSATSTATEAYYSTLLHELTHWTAPEHRCNRDLSGRFGTQAYAIEELVALS